MVVRGLTQWEPRSGLVYRSWRSFAITSSAWFEVRPELSSEATVTQRSLGTFAGFALLLREFLHLCCAQWNTVDTENQRHA